MPSFHFPDADDADNADSFFYFSHHRVHGVPQSFIIFVCRVTEALPLREYPEGGGRWNIHFLLYFSLSWYKEKVTKDYTLVLKILRGFERPKGVKDQVLRFRCYSGKAISERNLNSPFQGSNSKFLTHSWQNPHWRNYSYAPPHSLSFYL